MKKKKKKQETGEFTADDRHHSQPDPQHLRKGTLDSVAIHGGRRRIRWTVSVGHLHCCSVKVGLDEGII